MRIALITLICLACVVADRTQTPEDLSEFRSENLELDFYSDNTYKSLINDNEFDSEYAILSGHKGYGGGGHGGGYGKKHRGHRGGHGHGYGKKHGGGHGGGYGKKHRGGHGGYGKKHGGYGSGHGGYGKKHSGYGK